MALGVVSSNPPPLVDTQPGFRAGHFFARIPCLARRWVNAQKPCNCPNPGSPRRAPPWHAPGRDLPRQSGHPPRHLRPVRRLPPSRHCSSSPSRRLSVAAPPGTSIRGRKRPVPGRGSAGGAFSCAGHFTFIPGRAPLSGDRMKSPGASPEAASTMPSLMPNFILRGARLATITVRRPTSASGA